MLEDAYVGGGVVLDGDEVGESPRLDAPHAVRPAKQIRGIDSGGLEGLHRRQAVLHHVGKLFGVVAVRVDARVGTEGHLAD